LLGEFFLPNAVECLTLYLSKKSVNRSDVTRKTGISKTRLSELSNNTSTKLRADELYLIALAIDVEPYKILNEICKDLELQGL
jgi:putative transcriptional regulator